MGLGESLRAGAPVPLLRAARAAKHAARVAALRGDQVECPLCRKHYARFLPNAWGTPVVCPSCGSMQRHRRMALFLRRSTDIGTAPLRVLHLAPEPSIRRELQSLTNLDYVTGDLLAPDVDVHVDVTAMPFPDASFDVVICSHVLEHVIDDRSAMRELHRVLTEKGWALLDVPCSADLAEVYEDPTITDPAERLRHFGQEDHVRVYSIRGFVERLQAAGFHATMDPLEATDEERARYVLDGGAGIDHSFFCVKASDPTAR